jgi:hypothetical protein
MLAIVPVIIMAGGLSIGAFNNDVDVTDEAFTDNIEMNMSANEIASLEPFPLD